jgi:putative ABC transport system substrate-binding protein
MAGIGVAVARCCAMVRGGLAGPLHMRRRDFIGIFGSAAAWPLAARAQQGERMRRIGVLMPYAESDTEAQAGVEAFREAIRKLGWTSGANVQIDERWGAGESDRIRTQARELVNSKPDAILVRSPRALAALQRETRSVPIVFVAVSDPIGAGFVASLSRPGGNITGFSLIEFPVIGKMLELLKQIAPSVARVALVSNPENPSNELYVRAFEAAATSFAVQPITAHVRHPAEIERAIEAFAREPNGGLLIPPDVVVTMHRELFVALAARHRLPAIYSDRALVSSGGLMYYGVERIDLFRRAASYVDRILKGDKPGDLPIQQPTKFELMINVRTARALGLEVPPALLALADEVIE